MRKKEDRQTAIRTYFSNLAAGAAAVQPNRPLGRNCFIDVTIEGHRFQGLIGDLGPYLLHRHGIRATSYLGVSVITLCRSQEPFQRGLTWFVAKHDTDGMIDLSCLTDAGRRALAIEFGLVIRDIRSTPHYVNEMDAFLYSKAFDALRSWVESNPRRAADFEQPTPYLGDWVRTASSARSFAGLAAH